MNGIIFAFFLWYFQLYMLVVTRLLVNSVGGGLFIASHVQLIYKYKKKNNKNNRTTDPTH